MRFEKRQEAVVEPNCTKSTNVSPSEKIYVENDFSNKRLSFLEAEVLVSGGDKNFGYKHELYRGFNSIMAFSFCFTSVAVVTSVSGLFTQGLAQGGPAVLMWSWIFGSIMTFMICLTLAEISSAYPTSGSVYHWSALLASKDKAPLASFITGWANALGNCAGDAFFAWAFAVSWAATCEAFGWAQLTNEDNVAVALGCTALWALTNLLRIDHQGVINNVAGMWQILTTVVIVAGLYVCAAGAKAQSVATLDEVFFTFYNATGFESAAYVVLIGILVSAYSFTGYEAASHMAEETKNAPVAIPRGIVLTGIATAVTGFVLLFGLLLVTANDVDRIITNNWTITDIFIEVAGPRVGPLLSLVLSVNMYFSGMSSLTTTARLLYAMARDGAFPFSDAITHVCPRTHIPTRAVLLTLLIDFSLILLNLFSETAFNAITSVATIGFQVSYAIPIFLRLTTRSHSFPKAAFSLKGHGVFIAWCSFIWLAFTSLLFMMPTQAPVTLSYAPVIVIGFTLCGAVYWSLNARFWFKGPITTLSK